MEALPAWVGDYVQAVATETETPVDLPGRIALAALSTAAGGRAEVEVRGRWHEPVNIFTVVALPPGSRRSAVFSAIIRPLLDVERDLANDAKVAIAAAELERRIATERAEKAARTAIGADPLNAGQAIGLATDAAMAAESADHRQAAQPVPARKPHPTDRSCVGRIGRLTILPQ